MRKKKLAKPRSKSIARKNIRDFERKGVQAYRLFRQLKDEYDKPSALHREIAQRLDWSVGVVPGIISQRRKKVSLYLRQRHLKTTLRLAYEGWTNKAIGKRLKLHPRTVSRLLHEGRASQMGGANA